MEARTESCGPIPGCLILTHYPYQGGHFLTSGLPVFAERSYTGCCLAWWVGRKPSVLGGNICTRRAVSRLVFKDPFPIEREARLTLTEAFSTCQRTRCDPLCQDLPPSIVVFHFFGVLVYADVC